MFIFFYFVAMLTPTILFLIGLLAICYCAFRFKIKLLAIAGALLFMSVFPTAAMMNVAGDPPPFGNMAVIKWTKDLINSPDWVLGFEMVTDSSITYVRFTKLPGRLPDLEIRSSLKTEIRRLNWGSDPTSFLVGEHGVASTVRTSILVSVLDSLAAALVGTWLWLRFRRKRRAGHCSKCGYDLCATPDRCPECGTVTTARVTAEN